jgi:hypothetical protein
LNKAIQVAIEKERLDWVIKDLPNILRILNFKDAAEFGVYVISELIMQANALDFSSENAQKYSNEIIKCAKSCFSLIIDRSKVRFKLL